MTTESKMVGEILVEKVATYFGIGYRAWEPTLDASGWRHSSLTMRGTAWLGKVGTVRLPAEIDAIPFDGLDGERVRRVHAWQAAEYARAYAAIEAAFPEASNVERRDMGEIDLYIEAA